MLRVVISLVINDELLYRALVQVTFNEIGIILQDLLTEVTQLREQLTVVAKVQSFRKCNDELKAKIARSERGRGLH